MKKRWKDKKKLAALKCVLILELIVCYMAVLNIVSHNRGPRQYAAASETPLLIASDFMSFDGISAENVLTISSDTQDSPTGYWADLTLAGLERIAISFQLVCPPEYAGKILSVDLYNHAYGYDSEDQEFKLTLQEGVNEVAAWITLSDFAPDEAQLRIFTVDIAGYQVENLQIFQEIPLAKVTPAMIAVTTVCILAFGITLILYLRKTGHMSKLWGEK